MNRLLRLALFALAVSTCAFSQMSVTGNVTPSQIVGTTANPTLNISLFPTTGISATKLNGTDISAFTGILRFTAGAPAAATAANIVTLFDSGTCSGYLKSDATCGTPAVGGGGTVTSVGLSTPSFFTVGNTPIISSGVLAVTYATGLTANQVLSTDASGAAGLRALTSAMIPAINLAATGNGGVTGSLPNASVAGLAASATADTTNATNIATGTLANARMAAVNLAGTGNGGVTGSLPNASVAGLAASATTDTTNAANITTGTLPAGRLSPSAQIWNSYTVSYTNLSAASTTSAYTVASLGTKQIVCGLAQRVMTAFAGSGVTGLTETVGDSNGSSSTYSNFAYNLLGASTNTNVVYTNVAGAASDAGGNIQVNATSSGANLNALTAGSLRVSVCTVTLP